MKTMRGAPPLPCGGNTLAALYCILLVSTCLQSCPAGAAFVNSRSSFHATTTSFATLRASVADHTTTTTTAADNVALLGSTTVSKEHYDIVSVDLDDGRDYPIYIGTGYSEDEGK
jgi:hypothetical protein